MAATTPVRKGLKHFTGMLLDLVFPMACPVCGRGSHYLCEGCVAGLPRLAQPYCPLCADPGHSRICEWCAASPPSYDAIRAPYLMEGPVRTMVHSLKYRNLKASAPYIGGLMASYVATLARPFDVVTCVPLHPKREKKRGYNQSELVACDMARRIGQPFEKGLLHRIKDTPPQVAMHNPDERRANMLGAFECATHLAGRSVLIFDDVVTTGATISACAAALKDAGAANIFGLAFARQPHVPKSSVTI